MTNLFIIISILFSHHINLFVSETQSNNKKIDLDKESYGSWKLESNDAGIKIYTRWVIVDDKLKVRQLKGEMLCDHHTLFISKHITDDKIASQWLNRAIEHKKLKNVSQNEWISYTLFKLPWPFENQDLVAKNTVHGDGESIIIDIQGVADFLPEKKGIKRIQNFEGEWKLTQVGNGKTLIEHTILTKVKPLAPRWITDPIIHGNFRTTLNNLQNMLQ
jgi:hypothetical protein